MTAWIVVAGNKTFQEIPIEDYKGDLVTDLASATEIKFQVKEKKEESESPLISKSKDNGIEVDQPEVGYLRITLDSSDTQDVHPSERYFMAVQVKWSEAKIYEYKLRIGGELTNKFIVRAGIIP